MIGFGLTLNPDGQGVIVQFDAPVSLETLQSAVGGYIEVVPGLDRIQPPDKLGGTVPCVAFCNEEGKLNGLPYNERATKAWADCLNVSLDDIGDMLVGPVIVLYGDGEFMSSI